MRNRLSRGLATGAVTALLSAAVATGVASVAAAGAGDDTSAPCARQQTQVDRATAKAAELQAVFNHEKRDLKKAERALANADTAKEKRRAKDEVSAAKADVAEAVKVKKAQVQRLVRAQQRLDACLAGGTAATDPSERVDPSASPAA